MCILQAQSPIPNGLAKTGILGRELHPNTSIHTAGGKDRRVALKADGEASNLCGGSIPVFELAVPKLVLN